MVAINNQPPQPPVFVPTPEQLQAAGGSTILALACFVQDTTTHLFTAQMADGTIFSFAAAVVCGEWVRLRRAFIKHGAFGVHCLADENYGIEVRLSDIRLVSGGAFK